MCRQGFNFNNQNKLSYPGSMCVPGRKVGLGNRTAVRNTSFSDPWKASTVEGLSSDSLKAAPDQLVSMQQLQARVRQLEEEKTRIQETYDARIQKLEEDNASLLLEKMQSRSANQLYLKMFADFPALIWRSRVDKQCDYFNNTWLEWTGKTLQEEFGKGWTKGVHPDDYDGCLETYVAKFDAREPFYMEYRLLNKHGEYRWIGDHGQPFYDLDGTFLGYIGSCYDIDDQKNREKQLLDLNATKNKLFSIIAHDLRNPMATFVSLSECLMENHNAFDPEEMTEIAHEMHKDSKNTLHLLENLLDWSRSQTSEISFRPQAVNLQDLFVQVAEEVELCAKAKRISIIVPEASHQQQENKEEGEVTVYADPNMIRTVLRNLVMNAIKFSQPGQVVSIEADSWWQNKPPHGCPYTQNHHEAVADDTTVLVAVTDHGVGMSEFDMAGLFDLMPQDGNSKSSLGTANERGTGLGLVLCKEFIEKHKGNIWAQSLGPRKGSQVKFTLPRASSGIFF